MSNHSVIPPSSAHMWVKCHGWLSLNKDIEERPPSQASIEGTTVHDLVVALLLAGDVPRHTPEMREAVDAYISSYTRTIHFGDIEAPVRALGIHPLSKGTIDYWSFNEDTRVLCIRDLKYGYGVVEAFENWQLVNYAAGILDLFPANTVEEVQLGIFQPRAYHPKGIDRWWITTPGELEPYFDKLRLAADANIEGDGKLQAGSHCRYCKALHKCPAASDTAINLYEASLTPWPLKLSGEALGLQYKIIQRAKAHIDSFEAALGEEVQVRIEAGQTVPGYSLVERGREVWTLLDEDIIMFGKQEGHDLRKKGVITPKQARKGGFEHSLSHTKTTKNLVADDNSEAKLIFNQKEKTK